MTLAGHRERPISAKMSAIKPLPKLPENLGDQPTIVAALDDIRFTIEDDDRAEFAWFAREYPRIFRYHIYHAEHRLEDDTRELSQSGFGVRVANYRKREPVFGVKRVGSRGRYTGDFEAFLNAVDRHLTFSPALSVCSTRILCRCPSANCAANVNCRGAVRRVTVGPASLGP